MPGTPKTPFAKSTFSSPLQEKDLEALVSAWKDKFFETKEKLSLAEKQLGDTTKKVKETEEKFKRAKKIILKKDINQLLRLRDFYF